MALSGQLSSQGKAILKSCCCCKRLVDGYGFAHHGTDEKNPFYVDVKKIGKFMVKVIPFAFTT